MRGRRCDEAATTAEGTLPASPPRIGPAIAADGLTKRFGDLVAVDGIAFSIDRGECFGFLGPNGAGKTTTMRMLSCLARRDHGSLHVLDHDPDVDPRGLKARLGVVAQEINLDLELTVRENLLVYARYFDVPKQLADERVADLLDFVELKERGDWRVDRLSGGMQRRVQIARALINDPDVVLLDEPTTGLDPQARHLVWARLRALKSRGVTLVVTTHYMDEAEQLCDRLVVMDAGHIVREGTPPALIADEVGGDVVEVAVKAERMDALIQALGSAIVGWTRRTDVLWLYGPDGATVAALAEAAEPSCKRLAIRRATLEDVFLQVTGHNLRED
ncbi:MAG TPA: ABC transporter ATP-binding protein [Miltoncostaeales bacterium]|nr:ABC transporter ATP-binding protein [Miltoncostaeales bacterium]